MLIPSNHAAGSSDLDGRLLHKSHFDDDETLNSSYIRIGESSSIGELNEPMIELLDTDYEDENELNTFPKVVGDGFRETREEIEQVAVGLLAARAMTVPELRKKLRGKKYPFEIVETILADFKSRGMLNDGMYAESFTRSRWLSSTWGPRRIRLALHQKGVGEKETESARKQVFEEDDNPEGNGENMQHGMSKLSMDRLFLQASKQWLRSQNTCTDKRKARIVRWLQYRGFDWEVTYYILKKLEFQHPM